MVKVVLTSLCWHFRSHVGERLTVFTEFSRFVVVLSLRTRKCTVTFSHSSRWSSASAKSLQIPMGLRWTLGNRWEVWSTSGEALDSGEFLNFFKRKISFVFIFLMKCVLCDTRGRWILDLLQQSLAPSFLLELENWSRTSVYVQPSSASQPGRPVRPECGPTAEPGLRGLRSIRWDPAGQNTLDVGAGHCTVSKYANDTERYLTYRK